MRVWITNSPYPTDAAVLADANEAGASVVLHGIPPVYADVIPDGTLGVFDVPDPELVAPLPTDAERIAELEAILAALLGDPP